MSNKASVIIPVYNGYRWATGILESTLCNKKYIGELILVNDGEDEDFLKLLDYLRANLDLPVKYFYTQGRQGPAVARNIGLNQVSCTYIAFLDCDDVWLPDSLYQRIQLLEDNTSAPFAYCSVQFMNERGELRNKYFTPLTTNLNKLLVTNFISLPSVVIRRSFLGSVRFPVGGHEDYFMWLNLLRMGSCPAVGLQEIGIKIRIVSGSVSSNKTLAARWHFEVLKSFGVPLLIRELLFVGYAINGVLKKKIQYTRPLFFGLDYLASLAIKKRKL